MTNREVTYPHIAEEDVGSRLTMPLLRLVLVEDYMNTFYPQSRRRKKDFLKNLTRSLISSEKNISDLSKDFSG